MKKISLLITGALITVASFAQTNIGSAGPMQQVENTATPVPYTSKFNRTGNSSSSRAASYSWWMNYAGVDFARWNALGTGNNFYSTYPVNKYFDTTFRRNSMNWAAMIMGEWVDNVNNTTFPFNSYPANAFRGEIDSLVISVTHKKVTPATTRDTIRVSIKDYNLTTVRIDSGPSAPVLWSQDIILDTSYARGAERAELLLLPGLMLAKGQRCIIQVDYMGPLQDTLFLYTNFRDQNCADACLYNQTLVPSGYVAGTTVIPNTIGFGRFINPAGSFSAFTYQVGNDCDGDGAFAEADCEQWIVQDIEIFPHIKGVVDLSGSASVTSVTNRCLGDEETINLTVFGAGATPTYQWYISPFTAVPAGQLSSTTVQNPTVKIQNTPVTYRCVITSGTDTASVFVGVGTNAIAVNLGPDKTISCGTTASATASITGSTAGTITYAWNTGGTTASQSGLVAGKYWVRVTNPAGCSSTDTIEVKYAGATNTVDFTIPTGALCFSKEICFTNTSTDKAGYTWEWKETTGTLTGFNENWCVTFGTPGTKCLYLEGTKDGCKFRSATKCITVIGRTPSAGCYGLGIDNIDFSNSVSIFPNPTKGNFTLSIGSLEQDAKVEVYTLSGAVVKTDNIGAGTDIEKSYDFSNLGSGVYYIKVQAGTQVAVKKLSIM